MSEAEDTTPSRSLPVLLVLFVGSGCAALIFEVIWFELLRQIIGASSVSLAIVLTSYMGGLFAGSWGFPYVVSRTRHPLRVYAFLELGIGILGLALLVALPLVRHLYIAGVGYGSAGLLLRAFVCLLCLLPPTILMGATLPAIARWMTVTRVGISRIGFLYMANLAGAVLGAMVAGFYLLPVHDVVIASAVASAVNLLIALAAFALSTRATGSRPAESEPSTYGHAFDPSEAHRLIYVVIGISGFTALGAQVVWTRLMSLLFGASVYTFTIILSIFLFGLGVGSSFASYLVRRGVRPDIGLAGCQLGLIFAIPFCAHMIGDVLPFWTFDGKGDGDFISRCIHDMLRAMVALLPATMLWGCSFPLALAAAARRDQEPGSLVGGIYAANTLGAILGALLFGLVLIPWIGTERCHQLLAWLSGVVAIGLVAAVVRRACTDVVGSTRAAVAGVVAMCVLTWWTLATSTPLNPRLVSWGHERVKWDLPREYKNVVEGRASSAAVSYRPDSGFHYFHVGGKTVASSTPSDMRLQVMLGHLPALIHPDPKSVLIVGFGAGVTAGSFVLYPGIERIVICEIEPRVPVLAGEYFVKENNDVLNDPRTELIHDDARHFIATTHERFDIITSEPIHPWVKGSAALYSVEYFQHVKDRLKPGGFVTQWVPLYQSSEAVVKTEIATFCQVFPQATVWNSNPRVLGYDLVLLGQDEPPRIDVPMVLETLEEFSAIRDVMRDAGIRSAVKLLGTYVSNAADLNLWLRGAELNRDRSLRLQYMAGVTINRYEPRAVFESMLPFRRYPEQIFVLPAEAGTLLRQEFHSVPSTAE